MEKISKKGEKIVKSLFDTVICRDIQTLFTWTGKSASGANTKLAFNVNTEIIGTIHAVIRRADPSYSVKQCEYDLKYRVFKHVNAYRKSNR